MLRINYCTYVIQGIKSILTSWPQLHSQYQSICLFVMLLLIRDAQILIPVLVSKSVILIADISVIGISVYLLIGAPLLLIGLTLLLHPRCSCLA